MRKKGFDPHWGRMRKVSLIVKFKKKSLKFIQKICGYRSPTDFWNPKRAKCSNFPPQLSTSDSPGCPSRQNPKISLRKGRPWTPPAVVILSNIPPCFSTRLPTSSTAEPAPPQGFPGHSHPNRTVRLFEHVPLTYDLEMSAGMETPGQSQEEFRPGTF